MPPRFGWWTDDGVWLPLGVNSGDPQTTVFPITRLTSGVTPAAAEQQLHALHLELAKADPAQFPNDAFTTRLTNYLDITVASGAMRQSLRLLFGAVGFLLLIACANVANLQLAKATARAREMTIRLSIGAGRGRLVRQLLTESLMLSLLGGLLGLLFAYWITGLMVTLMPGYYVPNEARVEVNGLVLSFCLIVSSLTGIISGLVPALQSARSNLVEALKDESRASSTAAGGNTRALLVIAEVALSMVLLVSASLTIRSFVAQQHVELGFEPKRVMAVGLPLPPKRYTTSEQRNRFARELLDRVRRLPGVAAATIGNGGLPFGGLQSTFSIDGRAEAETRRITLHAVGADYLRTVGIPLRQGRMLTEQEINGADHVAVINQAAARAWPSGATLLGGRVRLNQLEKPEQPSILTPANASPYVTIVGVIGDARNDDLRNEPRPAVLVPYTLLVPPQRTLAIRSDSDSPSLINAVRAQVREMDREQPLTGPRTFEEILDVRTAQPRFTMALFSLFGALGLALAMAGIYSVLSYLVSMRIREIGVRLALGAQRADILRLILRTGARLVGVGIVIGIIASAATARLLGSQMELFQVTPSDPVSFLGVVVLLSVIALMACLIPGRRATHVDPMTALRYD